jgi:signal transduction histidine kinase
VARTCGRGLRLAGISLLGGIGLLYAVVIAALLPSFEVDGVRLPRRAMTAVRAFADAERDRALIWSGVRIERSPGATSSRELLWVLVNIPAGLVFGLLPACLLAEAVWGLLVAPLAWRGSSSPYWPISIVTGVASGVALPYLGPLILRAHARLSAVLLSPGRRELRHLAGEMAGASAAELRRIERDLHDGAQARLAGLGMNIGLAEQLVRTDPDLAVALLVEARESSSQALVELRDLVRGIHPPALAERGLDGAVHALAAALPLPVGVSGQTGGAALPVEAALYFAISEACANTVKHSDASRAWIELGTTDSRLSAVVGDDGAGGARIEPGGGLDGIRRRLAVFGGYLDVSSPPGGPTRVTMEVSCGW